MGDDLQAELEGLLRLMHLFARVDLDHLVEAHHADEVGGPVHPEVGLPSLFMVRSARGPFSPEESSLSMNALFSLCAFTASMNAP